MPACAARFASGAMTTYQFEREEEVVRVEPSGQLLVRVGAGTELLVDAALAGTGVIQLFEDWLRPHLDSGALEPVLERGGYASPGPTFTIPAAAICRRRSARSSTTS